MPEQPNPVGKGDLKSNDDYKYLIWNLAFLGDAVEDLASAVMVKL